MFCSCSQATRLKSSSSRISPAVSTIALANAVLVPETTFAAPEIFFPTVFVVFLTRSDAVSNPTAPAISAATCPVPCTISPATSPTVSTILPDNLFASKYLSASHFPIPIFVLFCVMVK